MIFNSLAHKHPRSFTLTSGLLLSACAFLANASSPEHTSGENQLMVKAQAYSSSNYVSQDSTKMFPVPKEGQVQHVLTLKTLEDEADYMLEIQIGQTKRVDCNKHGLTGKVNQKSVKGWGYNYYEVATISSGPSTMMACFDQALTERFVPIPTDLKMSYDSRLPKVIYLPENSQVRYRVWKVQSPFAYSGEKAK